jgi:sulfatase maturation enzyme AslB (radical SAM superfamily)
VVISFPSNQVRAVDVILTAACNLRCAYCYQRARPAGRMRWETLTAAVDWLAASRRAEVAFGFYGGEPLLEEGLLRRGVEYALRVLPSSRRRVRVHLTTNGTLLDLELASFLAAHRVEVQLSFDGVRAAQDRRAASTFAVLDARLDELRQAQPVFFDRHLSIGVTLTGANLTSLAESIDYFLARGVRTIVVAPRLTPDPDWSVDSEVELDRQIARVWATSLVHYRRTGRVPVTLFRRTAGRGERRDPPGYCGGGRGDAVTVDVDGRVTTCVMFAASYGALPPGPLGKRLDRLRLGHVPDPDLGRRLSAYPAAARATGLFDPNTRRRSRKGPCRRCRWRRDCMICPAGIAHIPGSRDPHLVPELPCAFNRVAARYRARFPPQPSLVDVLTGRASPLPLLATGP